MSEPLFSVVIFAWRPELIDRSVKAVLNQTYRNLEIVLVDAYPAQDDEKIGAKITEMVQAYARSDARVRVLRIPRFKQTLSEPLKNYEVTCIKALETITGKYFLFQNDDDFIANDYVEKMVRLLEARSDCISACGLPISVDVNGKETDGPRISNYRPQYMPGHIMVLDYTRGGLMFSSPGCSIFAFNREEFIRLGANCTSYDTVLLYVVVASAMTAYDESAIFYWVRHGEQFNVKLSRQGYIGSRQILDFIDDYDFHGRWMKYGQNLADEVVTTLRDRVMIGAAKWFAINLLELRPVAVLRVAMPLWNQPGFWLRVPEYLLKRIFNQSNQFGRRVLRRLKQAITQ